ncbi:MAG: AMMECR1 domain-containing protein, partial [Gammaproteobacteria bacterium]|nr:AMMECR1 domain-containing protein [Gammaproteobacteria bacterium]
PGIDGLIMEEGRRRGTFLPSVWESLAEPRDFLHHLKLKSGLPENYWSDDIKIQRYSVEEF